MACGLFNSTLTSPVFLVQLDAYLATIPISEDDPAVLFAWDPVAVKAFVQTANKHLQDAAGPPPEWLTVAPGGRVTTASVMDEVIAHLASAPHHRAVACCWRPTT